MYDNAYERFGMLGYQIWRAARLVVDTASVAGTSAQGARLTFFRQSGG